MIVTGNKARTPNSLRISTRRSLQLDPYDRNARTYCLLVQ
ncbi:hypothetical protein EG68_11827 [Paragonimus skrjabini miyazakii]|uniref:Uncharacterized protein n=1 Tax=Paragonimus skrjabini miyazakii TaxID=59628 RepID=A0A8S9YCJ0_9TREM|nr:hypothetical protein EG68_11827 [Paragonimus skrjabini miyazakii]